MNAAWPGPTHPTGPAGPGPSGPAGPNGPVSGPAEPPIPPADPLVAIRILLVEAFRLADAEITRAESLMQRVDEVCESERTRARIRLALTALERWSAAAGVDFPLGSGRASGLAVSAAPVGAVGGSGRGAQPSAAGVDVPAVDGGRDEGRGDGAVAAATFTTPAMPVPPWVESRRRLAEIGVGPIYDPLIGRSS